LTKNSKAVALLLVSDDDGGGALQMAKKDGFVFSSVVTGWTCTY
jgi:hypothetical protein